MTSFQGVQLFHWVQSLIPMETNRTSGFTGGPEGTLIFSYTRRLRPLCGVQTFEFHFFFWGGGGGEGLRQMNIFAGMMKLWINLDFLGSFWGLLRILREGMFIFRELGGTGNYFQGFGEQVRSFGGLGSPAKN